MGCSRHVRSRAGGLLKGDPTQWVTLRPEVAGLPASVQGGVQTRPTLSGAWALHRHASPTSLLTHTPPRRQGASACTQRLHVQYVL